MDKRQLANRRTLRRLSLAAIGMFGFGFLLVPIYNSLCKNLGINGKTNPTAVVYEDGTYIDKSRLVTVEFIATNNSAVPWDFYPTIQKIKLHPGEIKQVDFFAKNLTDKIMTVQAIPSVTPGLAAKYLKKTECFCFEQQTLAGKDSISMPLLFHLDPDLPKKVKTLTLAYTLFKYRQTNKIPGRIN